MTSYTGGKTRRIMSDQDIVALYLDGIDSETVGARAHCSATVVLDLVRQAGHPVRKPGGTPRRDLHKITDAEICRRYQEGQNGPQIADAAECSTSSVYNVLKRANIKRRLAVDAARANASAARFRGLRGNSRG